MSMRTSQLTTETARYGTIPAAPGLPRPEVAPWDVLVPIATATATTRYVAKKHPTKSHEKWTPIPIEEKTDTNIEIITMRKSHVYDGSGR